MTKRKHSGKSQSSHENLHRRPKGKGGAWIFATIVVAIIVAGVIYQGLQDDTPMPLSELTKFKHHGNLAFVTPEGDTLKAIRIELVEEPELIAAGLMFREELTDDQGMLFVLPLEEIQSFWMKNTVIPLDMIFANSTGRIVTIHENTTPYSKESYLSTEPAKWVVEVRAGFAEEYGIDVGDRLTWHRLDSARAEN